MQTHTAVCDIALIPSSTLQHSDVGATCHSEDRHLMLVSLLVCMLTRLQLLLLMLRNMLINPGPAPCSGCRACSNLLPRAYAACMHMRVLTHLFGVDAGLAGKLQRLDVRPAHVMAEHLAVDGAHHVLARSGLVQLGIRQALLQSLDLCCHDAVFLLLGLALANGPDQRVELAVRAQAVYTGFEQRLGILQLGHQVRSGHDCKPSSAQLNKGAMRAALLREIASYSCSLTPRPIHRSYVPPVRVPCRCLEGVHTVCVSIEFQLTILKLLGASRCSPFASDFACLRELSKISQYHQRTPLLSKG